ncbi:hypothetical protein [Corynebacterium sp. AOP12-C2-36]|uniref:hypothetical protein n=1 Tax=Corynebacterium sp. AOP12-C2-36 TaxID=3457723 RepID=UPI0040337FA2
MSSLSRVVPGNGISAPSNFDRPLDQRMCWSCEWDFHDHFPAGGASAVRPQSIDPHCHIHAPRCPRCNGGFAADCDCTEAQVEVFLRLENERENRDAEMIARQREELRDLGWSAA